MHKCRRNDAYQQLTNTIVIIVTGNEYQWMLKLVGKVWWETGYLQSLKVYPYRITY